jgi:hypothetical protein
MTTDMRTTRTKEQTKGAAGAGPREIPRPSSLLQKAIARRAYELYDAAGRPDGLAVNHWLQAEAEILAR